MRDVIHRQLDHIATWPTFAILFVLFVLCSLGFEWRKKVIKRAAGGKDVTLFDGRYSYTPDEGRDLLEMIGKRGQRIYAITQVTLDFVFPFVYGGLLVIMLFRLYGDPGYLLLVPLITVVADLLENLTTTYLALSYEGQPSPVTRVASIFTTLKWSALYVSLVLVLTGLVIYACRYRRGAT
ncbi:MAG: hypothetical protein LC776_15295 [Acidobacteria bacterium]|nr:hypothetical protein [Acidobacteriota bacterium]